MSTIDDYINELITAREEQEVKKFYEKYFVPYFEQQAKALQMTAANNNKILGIGGFTNTGCVGSYPVSGYKRSDGTVVEGYIRSCGAAHLGNASSDNSSQTGVRLTDKIEESSNTIKGYVNKFENEKKKFGQTFMDNKQREFTQSGIWNKKLPFKDYYKISLDLADKTKNVQGNERNNIYNMNNLPKYIDKDIIMKKIATVPELNKDDTTVVIPRDDSPLVKLIKASPVTKNLIIENFEKLTSGQKVINTSTTFPFVNPIPEKILFSILNKVDINNMKLNSNGSISFVITDVYDLEHIEHSKNESFIYSKVVNANNRAVEQQKKNVLKPYLLYIPVVFTKMELEKLF